MKKATLLEALSEVSRRLGAEDRERGEEISDLTDLGQGDAVHLGVVARQPAGGGALISLLVVAQYQAQGEGVLERDAPELPGQDQG